MRTRPELEAISKKLQRIIGKPSVLLQSRCPNNSSSWPTMSCLKRDCPWWVIGPQYNNCSFLAAEIGGHTLEEIGNMLGVSRERVRQIEDLALKKLRKRSELKDINDELVHQQSLAVRDYSHTAEDQEHIRQDESDFIHAFDHGDVGI